MKTCEHYTESIYYQFEQTAKYCKSLGIKIFQKLGIKVSVEEFSALDVIVQNSGICQRELARIILKDRANTGRILNSLERMGYIERFADTKNNRLVRKMKLTNEGKIFFEETSKKLRKYWENLSDVFSEEKREELMSLIILFRKSLEKQVEMNI